MATTNDSPVVTYGWANDTAHAATSFEIPAIQWESDFGSNNQAAPGSLLNAKAPLGVPETFKFECRPISNVYANRSDIEYTSYDANKKGITFLGDLNESVRVQDANGDVVLPFDFHFVLKAPVSSRVTKDMLDKVYARMCAAAFNASGELIVSRMIRGITDPRNS